MLDAELSQAAKAMPVSGVQVAPTILIVRTIDSIGHTTVHWDEGPVRPSILGPELPCILLVL